MNSNSFFYIFVFVIVIAISYIVYSMYTLPQLGNNDHVGVIIEKPITFVS